MQNLKDQNSTLLCFGADFFPYFPLIIPIFNTLNNFKFSSKYCQQQYLLKKSWFVKKPFQVQVKDWETQDSKILWSWNTRIFCTFLVFGNTFIYRVYRSHKANGFLKQLVTYLYSILSF
jgi:hypothetical protein